MTFSPDPDRLRAARAWLLRRRPAWARRLRGVETAALVWAFLDYFYAERGVCPSLREIGAGVYLSPSSVSAALDRLEMVGVVERWPGRRSVRLAAAFPHADDVQTPRFLTPSDPSNPLEGGHASSSL